MVDEGKIALRPAVELSYLNDIEQLDLVEAMDLASLNRMSCVILATMEVLLGFVLLWCLNTNTRRDLQSFYFLFGVTHVL